MASGLYANRPGGAGIARGNGCPAPAHTQGVKRTSSLSGETYSAYLSIAFLAISVAFPVPPGYLSPPVLRNIYSYKRLFGKGGLSRDGSIRGTADTAADL